jgi:hypothetical protein
VRVVDKVPVNYGGNYTLVYALRLRGVFAPLVFPGAMNGPIWNAYVLRSLVSPPLGLRRNLTKSTGDDRSTSSLPTPALMA